MEEFKVMDVLGKFEFIQLINILGTFAFAISGIRLAAARNFDWFGAFVVGFVTAIGGGTTRDLLLNETPFWMTTPSYLIVTALALITVIIFSRFLVNLNSAFFVFDAFGLGLFSIVGVEKTLECGHPVWVAIIMGMITGSIGGVIRDTLINEVPLIFRKDIYAVACIIGGAIYCACIYFAVPAVVSQIVGVSSVIIIRFFAVKYHIALPSLKHHD